MRRDDPPREVAPPQRATDRVLGLGSREAYTSQYGFAVGEAMFQFEIEARRKAAERFRDLQTRLAAINQQIERALQAHSAGLVRFQTEMDAAYALWLAASEAYETERIRGESSVTGLRNQAVDLIKE